jgi:hypothetical protein
MLLFGLSALPAVAGAQAGGSDTAQNPSPSSGDNGSQQRRHKGRGRRHGAGKHKGRRHGGRRAGCANGAQPDASTGCSGSANGSK